MTAILATFGLVVVLILLGVAIHDHRARARGRRLRGGGSWLAIRETRRDVRGSLTKDFGMGDAVRWSAASRRNADAEAQRRREEQ